MRLRLETGRKHQIRAQLSERGWPIVGDSVYGKTDAKTPLMLRAQRLSISHPRTSTRMTFEVPVDFP
jgi:23S rRNA pseudouridine1911/1915/1917 synthase